MIKFKQTAKHTSLYLLLLALTSCDKEDVYYNLTKRQVVVATNLTNNLIEVTGNRTSSQGNQRITFTPNYDSFFCLKAEQDLYALWGITQPSQPCPYKEGDKRVAMLKFTDGTSLQVTRGPHGDAGVSLQDEDCENTTRTYPDIIIRWIAVSGPGYSIYGYPVFGCDSATNYKIRLKSGNAYRLFYSTTNVFKYYNSSTASIVAKTIDTIELL